MTRTRFTLLFAAALASAAAPLAAGNGHFLHGVGAVNSAMGGAGVGLPNDPLGALNLNPALLTELDGNRFAFAAEYADASNAVESQVGPFSGRTEESGDEAIIPAFGWTRHKPGSRFASGMGFLGRAGFGVDYPQDPTNPILAPQPVGFGRVYAAYEYLHVPTVLAMRVNDRLSLGISIIVGRSSLTANPAGFASPDCSAGGVCFVPSVEKDSAFGFGAQVGVLYKINPAFSIGAAYTLEQDFEDFEWNSTVANPNLPNFGAARTIRFQLNNPAIWAVGLGFTPTENLKIALDAKRAEYGSAEGFSGPGSLGWEDIDTFAIGVQYQATPMLALRVGYNKTDNAIPDASAFFNVASPSIWGDHYTGGLGLAIDKNFSLDLAYYKATKTEISSPFLSPVVGPVPGTRVKNEMSMESLLATFSFKL